MTKSYQAPGITQLTPYLTVTNVDEAVRFYDEAFGFKLVEEGAMKDESGTTVHAHMAFEDAHIMCGLEGAFDSPNRAPTTTKTVPGMGLYIYCKDVDTHFKKATSVGAKPLMEPNDTFWGDRICKVADKDGHEWTFATFTGHPQG